MNPDVSARRLKKILNLLSSNQLENDYKLILQEILDESFLNKIINDDGFWLSYEIENQILNTLNEKIDLGPYVFTAAREIFFIEAYDILSSNDSNLDYEHFLTRITILLQNVVRYLSFVIVQNNSKFQIKLQTLGDKKETKFDLVYLKGLIEASTILYQIKNWKLELIETSVKNIDTNYFDTKNLVKESSETIFELVWEEKNLKVGRSSIQDTNSELKNLTFVISKEYANNETKYSYIDINEILERSQELHVQNKEMEAAVEVLSSLKNDLIAKQKAMSKDLKMARNIQKGIIPQTIPDWKGLQFSFSYMPLQEVSGDYYDYFMYGSNKIGIMLSDVSGHGIPAAFITAISKLLFTNYKLDSPSEIFSNTNRELIDLVKQQGYLTCFYGIIDSNYDIVYSLAGHPRPLLQRYATGEVSVMEGEGTFLGMFTDADKYFRDYRVKLEPGDKLFVYTDGFMEGQSDEGTPFEMKDLISLIKETKELDIKETVKEIMLRYNDFCKGTDQSDDVTFLGIGLSLRMAEFEELRLSAEKEFNSRSYVRACEYLLEAKQIFPSDVNVLYLLGKYYTKLKDYSNAIIHLEEYNILNQSNADAHLILGYCYFKQDSLGKAEMEFLKSASLRSQNTGAIYNLARTYIRMKNFEKAIESLHRVLNFDPDHIQAKKTLQQIKKYLEKKS
ncbi:MAG: SpoIIE family protein phosphatase [Leptospiraceae bacterium]|nr:SpoIIE family protein phosphatase [Leptospiraceae bacterium]